MSRHRLTYIDMHPAPVEREPSPLTIWAGAAFAVTAVWCVTVLLFSL
jgi:hypothetical protein